MKMTIDRNGGEFRAVTLTKQGVAWIGNDRDGKNRELLMMPSRLNREVFLFW
jgi:hypothetical protein